MFEYPPAYYVMLALLVVACASSLSLPLLYAFSKVWRRSVMGWIVMVNYASYAFSLILTFAFNIGLVPPLYIVFILEAIAFLAISVTSVLLARKVWVFNFSKKHRDDKENIYS